MKILFIIKGLKRFSDLEKTKAYQALANPDEAQFCIADLQSVNREEFPENFKFVNLQYSDCRTRLNSNMEQDESLIQHWQFDGYLQAELISKQFAGRVFDLVAVCSDDNAGFFIRPAFSDKGIIVSKFTILDFTASNLQQDHFAQLREDWLNKVFIRNQTNLIESSYSLYRRIQIQLGAGNPGKISNEQRGSQTPGQKVEGSLGHIYKQLRVLPEASAEQIAYKLQLLWDISSLTYLDRIAIWNEISRLERLRGQIPYWIVYQLRILKNLNYSVDSSILEIQSLLRQAGYPVEAEILPDMYQLGTKSDFDSYSQNHIFLPEFTFHKRIDYRHSATPKVSVIVSMYNADNKLEIFLKYMAEQTLHKQGRLEIILVDSASPGRELEIATRLKDELGLSILYLRSKSRETIQTSWNRGISESRAPYLSFLGVDESASPQAMELLAAKLDQDPSVDWITGSAVAFDVDLSGKFGQQTMFYDRSDMVHDQIFFDTTQLSWVGALYRKNIHERFGYYDGTFTAAGDTEFKNRIFSKIKVQSIPDILGFYLNYPEERMTEHPRAEIEDLRALYRYKSSAGVEYSYRSKSVASLEAQIIRALSGFRKTFGRTVVTDIDYASSALKVLRLRDPKSPLLSLETGVEKIKEAFRRYEYIEPFSQQNADKVQVLTERILLEVSRQHSAILGKSDLNYSVNSDNRFQYYSGPWRNRNAELNNIIEGRARWI